MAQAPTLEITRRFSTEGVHPYDEVVWERRDVVQKNWKTGETVFEQTGVEYPDFWSENASTIVTTKYFRGAPGSPERESSLRQVLDRVVNSYAAAATRHGYMSTQQAEIFRDELTWLLLNQHFSFNSPVWFNVGTASPQQVSACFILSVDDSMDSILNWYKEEGFIFKGGSGAGVNLSRIRGSRELLSNGGTASGPVSFMRGADASAGTIKSGGSTRRAAKMVVLDVDHPDIEEFIETKAREEHKIRALRDAGFDMDLGGKDITSVQYQNANNSVRVSDEFMTAVENGSAFALKPRTAGGQPQSVDARELYAKLAQAAWECADPGIQYNDTINAWHTNPVTGPITASNPCSEYMSLDNSSCNLASLNLLKFLNADNTFDIEAFVHAVEIVITAMEISISFADFPTEAIGKTTRDYRQLGIGYANLGALLMASGLAYDSPEGRTMAAAITSVLTAVSYRRSAEISAVVGPYAGYAKNSSAHLVVIDKHRDAAHKLAQVSVGATPARFVDERVCGTYVDARDIAERGLEEWKRSLSLGRKFGYRNAQASVLAPTGTIGFMMDCDTTGIEPDFSLAKFKKLVGGGSMQIVNNQVPRALTTLGYTEDQIAEIAAHVVETGTIVDAPHVRAEHYPVFDCAAGQPRQIGPMGHVLMMAACQPFLSGAISKTCNLPDTATVEEVTELYTAGWKLGLKALAIYRDNSKVGQPLADAKPAKENEPTSPAAPEVKVVEVAKPRRERLPRTRDSKTTSFRVGDAEGYMTVGRYEDGRPGEVFLKMNKQGSTMAGVMDAFSVALSIGLQYGVPLETFVSKFVNQRFEPAGLSDDPDVRMPHSIVDYIFRRLALDYLETDAREAYGIQSLAERTAAAGSYDTVAAQPEHTPEPAPVTVVPKPAPVAADVHEDRSRAAAADKPMCPTCGTAEYQQRAGSCYACRGCGNTTGCS